MEWPSDRLEQEIDTALRSETPVAPPTGFYGGILRRLETEHELRKRQAAWHWRCALLLFSSTAFLLSIPLALGWFGVFNAWIESVPGGWGRIDQLGYAFGEHIPWLLAAMAIAMSGIGAGLVRGAKSTDSTRLAA